MDYKRIVRLVSLWFEEYVTVVNRLKNENLVDLFMTGYMKIWICSLCSTKYKDLWIKQYGLSFHKQAAGDDSSNNANIRCSLTFKLSLTQQGCTFHKPKFSWRVFDLTYCQKKSMICTCNFNCRFSWTAFDSQQSDTSNNGFVACILLGSTVFDWWFFRNVEWLNLISSWRVSGDYGLCLAHGGVVLRLSTKEDTFLTPASINEILLKRWSLIHDTEGSPAENAANNLIASTGTSKICLQSWVKCLHIKFKYSKTVVTEKCWGNGMATICINQIHQSLISHPKFWSRKESISQPMDNAVRKTFCWIP